jgi:hypothetical protein
MTSCQVPNLSETVLRATPANDNYLPIDRLMKSFEPESILSRGDCIQPNKRNYVGLIVMTTICVLALAMIVVRLAV